MKIVDADLFSGSLPYGEHGRCPPSKIIKKMDDAGIDKGFVTPLSGFFEQENILSNRRFLREIRPYRERCIPVLTVNPEFSSWRDVLEMSSDHGCALKLLYRFHGYALAGIKCRMLLETLENHSMPVMVQIRFFEERTRPYIFEKLPDVRVGELIEAAASYPGIDFIFSSPVMSEASALMSHNSGNIYLTSSFLEGEVFLEEFFSEFAGRVMFGSNFPVFSVEPGVAKVFAADISPRHKNLIAWKNVSRIFPNYV